jgi:hypothetical protein
MAMDRWALVRDGEVRGYLLHAPVATEADEDALVDRITGVLWTLMAGLMAWQTWQLVRA